MFSVASVVRQLTAKIVAVLARSRAALPKFTFVWVEPDEDEDRAAAQRRVRAASDVAVGLATGAVGVTHHGAAASAIYRARDPHH